MARGNFNDLKGKVLERPGARERIDAHKDEMERELSLAEIRKAREFTQVQLAKSLDVNQSGVSRIEHETDLYLSTLRSYVEALGGNLVLQVQFKDSPNPIAIAGLADLAEVPAAQRESPATS